jgi:photosystem II stability/assembly factor-like uncharacterized protein
MRGVFATSPPPVPQAIAFQDAQHGLLAAGSRIEATGNGGRTWRVVVHAPLASPHLEGPIACGHIWPRSVSRSGSLTLALCTGQPSAGSQSKWVYRSRDGGRTWKIAAATPCVGGSGRAFGGIACYGYPFGIGISTGGFALVWETRGTLYVSRDAGSHWTGLPKVVQPEVDFAQSVAVLSGGVAFVLLANGAAGRHRLIATHDAGRTWRVVHVWP